MELPEIRAAIISRRKQARWTQGLLAQRAHVSLPTLRALEQGKIAEIGFAKLNRILTALGLDLELREANRGRPTLESLRNEESDD
jgi:transcriptional regulator with XRE-family HTH domain